MIRCCPYCLSCRINSFGPLLACLATLFIAEIYWVNLPTRIPHPLGFAREVNMTESGQRHARGSSAHLPFAWTRQERLLNFQPQEVSGAGVILNVTTAFLARNWSRYFFANCSEVKCVFYVCVSMHSPPHTCICTIGIRHKQRQSFKSIRICWKFWRTFCSKVFRLLDCNIAAFSLALCAFPGNCPRKTHVSISAEGLTVDSCLCSYPTWGRSMLLLEDYLALCLSESGVLKNCL